MKELISRFRANIITSGTSPFEEETWDEISVGSLSFQVSRGCSVILPQGLPMETDLRLWPGWWPGRWQVGIPCLSLTLTRKASAGGFVTSAFWDSPWKDPSPIPYEGGSSQLPVGQTEGAPTGGQGSVPPPSHNYVWA